MTDKFKYSRLLLPAAVAFLTACVNSSSETTMFQTLENSVWSHGMSLEFVPDSSEIAVFGNKPVNLLIHLRFNTFTNFKDVPLEILQESFSYPESRDTLTLTLFNGKEALGIGQYGIYTLTDTIPLSSLPEGWRATLTPLSESPFYGIQAVGISLMKQN